MLALQHRLGGYREYRAPPELSPFAESVWTYAAPNDAPTAWHRVLPDLAIDIELVCRRDAEGRLADAKLFVGGPNTRPEIVAFHPGIEIVAIKVKLEWGTAVTGLTPEEYFDDAFDLRDVDASLALRLHDAMAETRTKDGALTAMTAVVTSAMADRLRQRHLAAGGALDLIRRTHGAVGVPRLAQHVGLSERHLRTVVERDAGVGLKTYARTVRFLRAITQADAWPQAMPIAWSAIAANAGFYDQSHLIRDCHDVCGLTPAEILRERRAQRIMRPSRMIEPAHERPTPE